MLVLSRKAGEQIHVPDCGLTIRVIDIRGNRVRIGIAAPQGIGVYREEVWGRLGAAAPASLEVDSQVGE